METEADVARSSAAAENSYDMFLRSWKESLGKDMPTHHAEDVRHIFETGGEQQRREFLRDMHELLRAQQIALLHTKLDAVAAAVEPQSSWSAKSYLCGWILGTLGGLSFAFYMMRNQEFQIQPTHTFWSWLVNLGE